MSDPPPGSPPGAHRSGSPPGAHRSGAGLAARRAALRALHAVEVDETYANLAVPDAVAELADARDRAFASHLAYDTLRWQGTLEWALAVVSSRPLDDIEPALRRVLRLGALQLLRTGVPARAAVATSVALAREQVPARRGKGAGGFVNGVLRGLARRSETLPWPELETDPVEHLALRTGHPRWIVAELLGRYDRERTAAILHADDDPPGLALRVAPTARGAVLTELRVAGIEASAGGHPQAVRAPGADPRRLPAVTDGRAVVQDAASLHVVDATAAAPGERILDLCAGPGGKTTALAERVGGPGGTVVAVELHPHRAELIRAAARHLGHDNVEVRVGDGTAPAPAGEQPFDAVLVDAPCTGLGTGRRRPEVRWRRRPEQVTELAELQHRLLQAALGRVAPGGRLVYAVCTWTHAETEAVADRLESSVPGRLERLVRRQLLPDTDDTDGMFLAAWRVD